jgi:hypothetical protein
MKKQELSKTQKFINFFSANRNVERENDAYLFPSFPSLSPRSDLSEKLEMPLRRSNFLNNITTINKIESKGLGMSREAYFADFGKSALEEHGIRKKSAFGTKNQIQNSVSSTFNSSEGEEDIKIQGK